MAGGNLLTSLISGGTVLLDGAWGTELQARGLPLDELPDRWNLSQPGKVEEVAAAYVEAGSQVILTNTFRANRLTLGNQPRVYPDPCRPLAIRPRHRLTQRFCLCVTS